MAKLQGAEAQTLDDFLEAMGPQPKAPANLGNLPADAESNPFGSLRAETPEDQEPGETPPFAPEVPAEPAPPEEPEVEEEAPAENARLAALEARIAAQDRELQFFRAGTPVQQPPAAPPDPMAELKSMFQGFTVTPQDWENMQRDPALAAQYLQNAMLAAAAVGSQYTAKQLRAEFQPYANSIQQTQEMTLNQLFYGRHPELEQYADIVVAKAGEVRAEGRSTNPVAFVEETARRTHDRLKQLGVRVNRPAGSGPVSVRRLQPPRAEMSTRARGAGRAPVTGLQRDLDTFMAATRGR